MTRMNTIRMLKQLRVTWSLRLLPLLLWLVGCGAGAYQFTSPLSLPDDRRDIDPLDEQDYNHMEEAFDMQFTRQFEQMVDLPRNLRNVTNNPKQALNANAFDDVPNSSWFTHRIDRGDMSAEEIGRGPDSGDGPDTSRPWQIFRAKSEGVTPGFSIQDAHGDRYVIKFDPPGYPELTSGAEVVSTKILYALGYHVPENYITVFDPSILQLGEKVKFTDDFGRSRPMNQADLNRLLTRIEQRPDGTIRALASKYINGMPLGPFRYTGIRGDDPNDLVPHQHRRELRGLRTIAAWLNHFDTKSGNTFDSYVTDNGARYVRHYLMDFGSTLGSAAHGPTPPRTGHENYFDPHSITFNLLTLGLYVRPYERLSAQPEFPSIGNYPVQYFHPQRYKFIVPNPAFENATNLDGYWAAKLVTAMRDEHLAAAVSAGRYTNPDAAEALLQALKNRRDIIGNYWFAKINPLDYFMVESQGGKPVLRFHDLAVERGYADVAGTVYQWELRHLDRQVGRGEIRETAVPLELLQPVDTQEPWVLTLRLKRTAEGQWNRWVRIWLHARTDGKEIEVIGTRRQEW
jgi:hypothetical protein